MSLQFRDEMPIAYPILDDDEIDKHMLFILANKDDPSYIYLIAYDGKKPIGYLAGYIIDRPWTRPKRVSIAQELFVVKPKRGLGVAPKLMEAGASIALAAGVEAFECVGSYDGTDKMWAKFGFKPHFTYMHIPADKFMEIVRTRT